jgi:hypothetical protein
MDNLSVTSHRIICFGEHRTELASRGSYIHGHNNRHSGSANVAKPAGVYQSGVSPIPAKMVLERHRTMRLCVTEPHRRQVAS